MNQASILRPLNASFVNLQRTPRYQYLLLAAITLLAGVLRFYKLGQWSFWIDEIYTLNRAQRAFAEVDLLPLSRFLTGATVAFLGPNEWSARLVAALIGIISIPLLYLPIRKMLGAPVAVLSALLLAISPWHLYWSQNARFYIPLFLLYTLALLFFYFAIEQDHPWYLLVSLVLLALALQEGFITVICVPAVLGYLILVKVLPFEKPPGLRLRNLLPIAIVVIVYGFYEAFRLFYLGDQTAVYDFLTDFIGHQHSPSRVLASVVYWVGLPLFCLALFGGIYLIMQKQRSGLFLLLGTLVPLATLVVVAPFVMTFDRYVFVSLSSWVILGAVGLKEILSQSQQQGRVLALGVLLLLLADPLSQEVLYYGFQNGNRPDWKGAFSLVEGRKLDGDVVVTTRPELGEYYLGEKVVWSRQLNPNAVTQNANRVWFVIDNGTGYAGPLFQKWLDNNSKLVDVRDVYIPGKNMTMRVYLYDSERESFVDRSGNQ